MADVITLKNGRNEIVFDERSFLDLVDEHMGTMMLPITSTIWKRSSPARRNTIRM